MPRILLILFLLFAGWYIWQYIKRMPLAGRKKLVRSWGLLALVVVSLLLVALGKMHWVGAAIAAAIPLLRIFFHTAARALPLLQFWQRYQGKPSVIKTGGLEVSLDIGNGNMDGQIITGPHADKQLNSLSETELNEQYVFFEKNDRQSSLLLRAYLLRRGYSGYQAGNRQEHKVSSSDVTPTEALQILGLDESSTKEQIIRAHRQLIQKLHPDRGGNDYLAAKINAAKDLLINSHKSNA